MFGGMDIDKPVGPGRQKRACLLGNVGRMVIQNHPDRRRRRITGVDFFEQLDKLPTLVPIMDLGDDMSVF